MKLINFFRRLIKLDTVFAQLRFGNVTGCFSIFQTLLDVSLTCSQRTLNISFFERPDDYTDQNGKVEHPPTEILHLTRSMIRVVGAFATFRSKTDSSQKNKHRDICQRYHNFFGAIGYHTHNYHLLPRIVSQISPHKTSACFFSISRASPSSFATLCRIEASNSEP